MDNKPAAPRPLDYPDVLGMITGGPRFNANVAQCAFGIYPHSIAVGQVLEGLVLLQNACDKPIQVTVQLQLPRKDTKGNRISLIVAKDIVAANMKPGETGLLHIPMVPYPPTSPSENNRLGVKIEASAPREFSRVHSAQGGRPASILSISPFRLNILREVRFSTMYEGNVLLATFSIAPGHISLPQPELAPRYEVLWSARELQQEQAKYAGMREQAAAFAATLGRNDLMMPLIRQTERRYAGAGLPLHPAEALYIAKALEYILEDGLELEPGFSVEGSRWFQRLTGVVEDEGLLEDKEALVAFLYTAVAYDAVRVSLMMVERTAGKKFGTREEHAVYADEVAAALERQRSIDLGHAYLPLVLAGVLLNAKIKGVRENLWMSLAQLREAWSGRVRLSGTQHEWVDKVLGDFIRNAEQFLVETRVPRPDGI